MTSFVICLALLVIAYFSYGTYLEKVCKINPDAKVPSKELFNGVDYVPLPRWRVFLIQLLNIAGVGPIFGAILGACFGPVAFLWITFGGILLGAMHDYIFGVMIVRNSGLSLPEVIGKYLGSSSRILLRVLSVVLLCLVGVVFLRSPAGILAAMTPWITYYWWIAIIICYYFIATCLPVDKLIGKLYPIFGFALIFMAAGLMFVIFTGEYSVPEISFENFQKDPSKLPILPTMFITIACGAISGFHGTQTPIMARCVKTEQDCRFAFYGAMIAESIIALIWAAIAMAFFGGPNGLVENLAAHGNDAGWAVKEISTSTLGTIGGILAVMGVVAAPITSGDTAFRSARLVIADAFNIDQVSKLKRLYISIPLFAIAIVLTFVDFDIIWRYFSWTNQALATCTLWAVTVYLCKLKSAWIVAYLPSVFMTFICASFVFVSNQFVGLGATPLAYILGALVAAITSAAFTVKLFRMIRG